MTHSQKQQGILFGLVVLVMLAFALRIYALDSVPLRGDEAYNAIHWTKTPFSPAWMTLIEYEPNPGALVSYWAWSGLTGRTEFAFRYLPLLANVFGLAVILALTHRLSREMPQAWTLALLVGLLWAVNPFFIWYAQDARQYALLTALTPLNFYLLLRASEHNRRRDWLLYLLLQTYTVYTYYIELFWVVAQGLYVLTLRRRAVIWRFALVWVVILALLVPLFVQIYTVLFIRDYAGTAARADFWQLFSVFLPTLFFGDNTIPVMAGVAIVAALTIGLIVQRRWLLLLWVVIPMTLLTLASTQASLFLPRYVVAVAPALLISVVLVVYSYTRRYGFYAVLGLCVLFTAVSLVEVRDYFTVDPSKSADWPGLVVYLNQRVTEDDVLISDSIDPALEYYYTGPARIFFIPEDTPPPETFMPDFLDAYTALYLLSGQRTGPTGQYLQQHAQPVPGDTWPGVAQFRPWRVQESEIQHPLDLTFGEVARLRGYTILENTTLILYWEALQTTPTDHSVLLHLEAVPDAPPAAVLDHGIANGVISTRLWQPGTLYRDPIPLPVELSSGDYTIRVGMYPTGMNKTLSITGPEDNPINYEGRYPIGTLKIHKT